MSAQLIDGKESAKEVRIALRNQVQSLMQQGITPGLAVIFASDDPASAVYVRNKGIACEKVGILSRTIRLGADTTQQELLDTIHALNADSAIHGILLQLPTYLHLDANEAIRAIAPEKDVDGFHPHNAGELFLGREAIKACTPMACMHLLHRAGLEISGKHAVVLGRSNIVGKPVAMLLLQESATVTVCHSKTKNLADITKQADILISAIGVPLFVKKEMVKPGAAVIDVGINRLPDGTLVGDVDPAVAEVASHLTPVPGGVGPMTIAMLCKNTVEATIKYAKRLDTER